MQAVCECLLGLELVTAPLAQPDSFPLSSRGRQLHPVRGPSWAHQTPLPAPSPVAQNEGESQVFCWSCRNNLPRFMICYFHELLGNRRNIPRRCSLRISDIWA